MLSHTTPLLDRVSLTGADDNTSLDSLASLSAQYPFVEWALLYVPNNEGAPRNPTRAWRERFFYAKLPGHNAVHLCGKAAFEQILQQQLPAEILGADRIQLNINARKQDFCDDQVMEVFRRSLDLGPAIILQYHEGTAAQVHRFLGSLSHADQARVHVLLDSSRGTGELMSAVCRPAELASTYCGYAGGLNPDNTMWAISAIEQTHAHYWIDMESGIRTDNQFDVQKARRVLEVGLLARECPVTIKFGTPK
jgi:hypothetical protein